LEYSNPQNLCLRRQRTAAETKTTLSTQKYLHTAALEIANIIAFSIPPALLHSLERIDTEATINSDTVAAADKYFTDSPKIFRRFSLFSFYLAHPQNFHARRCIARVSPCREITFRKLSDRFIENNEYRTNVTPMDFPQQR
jgi:hypothetical protein